MQIKTNLSGVDEAVDFGPVPEGLYLVEVSNVDFNEMNTTKNGDPYIKLEFQITDGEFQGRKIWDNLIISENEHLKRRLKMFLNRIGGYNTEDVNLTFDPDDFQGKQIGIETHIEDYEASDGTMKKRNVIGFAGYKHPHEIENDMFTNQKSKSGNNGSKKAKQTKSGGNGKRKQLF